MDDSLHSSFAEKAPLNDTPPAETPARGPACDAWLMDIRDGRELYLYECTLRFFRNLCKNYRGSVRDANTFQPVTSFMSPLKAMDLYLQCAPEGVRWSLEEGPFADIRSPELEDNKNLMRALWNHSGSNRAFREGLIEWIDYAIPALRTWQEESPDLARARAEELRTLYSLAEQELQVILLETVLAYGFLRGEDLQICSAPQKVAWSAALLNMHERDLPALIDGRSNLRRRGCLTDDGQLSGELLSFLIGIDSTPLESRFYKQAEEKPLPWSYYGRLAETEGALVRRMLTSRPADHGMNILLYGEPGTGKTSFALTLAAELGLTPYLIGHPDAKGERRNSNPRDFRFMALQICASRVPPEKSLLIIDEADGLLVSASCYEFGSFTDSSSSLGNKAVLNDLIDTLRIPCVWITNTPAQVLDTSNRRRFDFSIRFKPMDSEQRETVWRNAATKHGLEKVVKQPLISSFASTYKVSAGGIDLALRNLGVMLKAGQARPAEAEQLIREMLRAHCRLLEIRGSRDTQLVGDEYSLEGLNIKGDLSLQQIEQAIRRFQREQGLRQRNGVTRPRMNLLLSGAPGTGKTEFVKYLGSATRTRVLTKMGSDLLDMYLGGTEQNIKQAFAEARAERAILFLDEADGLLQARERASRSWEVTQVNELLHQMEKFEGILVCATNFAANLDPATLRRFTFKLEFDFLDDSGKALFFRRMFSEFGIPDLTPTERRRLSIIPNLAPGDFLTVRQGLHYLGAEVTPGLLLGGLEKESRSKCALAHTHPAIGFRCA